MNDAQRLQQLIDSYHSCILISTAEEQLARQTTVEVALELELPVLVWSVTEGVREGFLANTAAVPDTAHPAAGLLYLANREGRFICVAIDLIDHLKDARTLRVLRDLIYRFEGNGSTLIMIDHDDQLPSSLEPHIARFQISLPNRHELEGIIRSALRFCHQDKPVSINLTRKDLDTITRNLSGLTRTQAREVIIDTVAEDRRFERGDINRVIAKKRQMLQTDGLLEYIETPAELSEIGGLARLKTWLDQRQNALGQDALDFGIDAPRGVLMLGVQGAGKSLCAKAIATAWQRPLLRMDPGSLYDRYVGESEKRLRMSLRQAEMMAPIILWIDEIEKAFASAASRSTDGGLSQRMFGTLLTWMQEHTAPVFLVATANDIEALPPELLRKGRFDEIFFVDLPSQEVRKDIFAIHLSKRKREPDQFDLERLAHTAEGFSGAEIEQAVIAALHTAFADRTELSTEIILDVVKTSPPLAVTMAEQIENLRHWAQTRCVPAQ